ncbi:MAG TPA: phosphopantetheine-binding protein [Steroidobacteraceae bacterium]|jgi:acyl carrier protein
MTTLERLSRILVQRYKLDPARLTPDQPLDQLGIDSLGMVEMLFFIEEEFRVHLPSEGITFGTLGDAATYIDQLIATQKSAPQATPRVRPDPTT